MNVDERLERAQIRLAPEDRERLARNIAFYESQVRELRVAEARYLEPAVIHVVQR